MNFFDMQKFAVRKHFPCHEVIGFLQLSHKFFKTCLKCLQVEILKYHFYQVFLYQVEQLERLKVESRSTATFINFGGIVSIPAAFLEFNSCTSFFISISFTK